jgi:hypothetical protein
MAWIADCLETYLPGDYRRAVNVMVRDELIADLEAELPASRSDYNWDTLQDVLFQDKDYDGFLSDSTPFTQREAELWFDEFGNVPPRDPHRGFPR